jgi:hypothetical protein
MALPRSSSRDQTVAMGIKAHPAGNALPCQPPIEANPHQERHEGR